MLCVGQYSLIFYCQIVFHCMDVSQFVYPVTSWRTLGLFPLFDDYEYSPYKRSCCVELSFLYNNYLEWDCWVIDECTFNFTRNCQTFSRGAVCTLLHSHQQSTCEFQLFHILTSTWYCQIFYFSLCGRCVTASHCGFDLHFPDAEPGWVSLNGLIYQQCVLFGEVSVQILYSFLFPIGFVSNCWVLQALYMFQIQVFYLICDLQRLSPSLQLSFSSSEQGLPQSKSVLVLMKSYVFLFF